MPSTLDPNLLQRLLQLPDEQRSELAGRLIESLEDADNAATPEEIKLAWLAELDRRAGEADSGAVLGVSYDQAWQQIAGEVE